VNGFVLVLMALLAIWMIACGYYGYTKRFVRFLIVLCVGLTANVIWMMVGLDASLGEPHMLIALASAAVYGACAFGIGLLAGRLVRAWRASTVDSRGV
jgi:hypothetical protein